MSEKKKTGRPPVFGDDIRDLICERLAKGESMKAMCEEAGMPNRTTIFDWLAKDKVFADKYARAREAGLEILADELLEISDAPVGSTDTGATDNGAVQKQKLQVDTRKWLLSKLVPKKYGDRQDVHHSGSIGLEALVGNDPTE